jgi:hypothetical protein
MVQLTIKFYDRGETKILWYQDQHFHRVDGPAFVWDYSPVKQWYFKGTLVEDVIGRGEVSRRYKNAKIPKNKKTNNTLAPVG